MNRPSDPPEDPDALRDKIIGLGERSCRKSYYPQLLEQIEGLKRFRALLDQSNDAIFLMNVPSGQLIDVNESACKQLSYSRERLLSLSLGGIAGPATFGPIDVLFRQGQPDRHESAVLDTTLLKSDGEEIPVEISIRLVAFGGTPYAVAAARDITERQRAEELIRETARRQEAILDSIPDIAWLKDRECRYISVNQAYGRLTGLPPAEMVGRTDLEIWPPEAGRKYMDDDRQVMESGKRLFIEEQVTDSKGILRWYETIKTPVSNERGEVVGTTGIARDLTRRKRMEATIQYQAHHDLLTGLPNRMLFMDHLELKLSEARRGGAMLAVLFLDIDRFKNINDALGHAAGDLLLKEIAARIAACLRDTDTIARIGGDEFAILLPQATQAENAARIAEKIQSTFKVPYTIDRQQLHVAASIGISIYPDDGEHAEALLKHADIAMYQAKDQGRNNFQFYNPAINVRTIERIILENRLREALERGELVVHYQPLIDLATRQVVCVEALVRWRHPELGLLDPVRFIPLAEEIGFILPIDKWVLRTACMQNKAWQEKGHQAICVSVNLSSGQFEQTNLLEVVSQVLRETGLDPAFLGIEITETIAMKDTDLTIRNLARLAGMGIKFSVDDFGTGYSSLSYLKRMPLQKLKIDKSFIRGLARDPDYEAIVNAVIAMAHSLKLRVVAEGVETDDQLSLLHARGCDEVQGYFFSEPLPAEQFEKLLVTGKEFRGALATAS